MKKISRFLILGIGILWATHGFAQEVKLFKVDEDLTKINPSSSLWSEVSESTFSLMAQPMVPPRPTETHTPEVHVKAVHNGEYAAFLMRWSDEHKSDNLQIGYFHDAVAIQFPVGISEDLPAAFMGQEGAPVQIYHWRSLYQRDKDEGKADIKDIYPNMHVDGYPMEFPDAGNLKNLEKEQDAYKMGIAAGNPQSFAKKEGLDELLAEGFGTSAVVKLDRSFADGKWDKNEWKVVFVRPLKSKNGSTLGTKSGNHIAFAVWQGDEGEVGGRKSVTMSWFPIEFQNQKAE